MALKSVGSVFEESKGWIGLGFAALVLFSFRRVFTGLGNAAGDGVESLTAKLQADAQAKLDQQKVKTSTGSNTQYTSEQIAKFRSDAETLAGMLGQGPLGMATIFKDQSGGFGLIKAHYARLNLYNNKPFYLDAKGNIISQTVETKASATNKVNYHVLEPFYKDFTNGRSLVADFRYYVTGSAYTALFKWIL